MMNTEQQTPEYSPVRLLCIEDEKRFRQQAKEVLEERVQAGVIEAVDYATTHEEAMDLLGRKQYQGILSDIFFPRTAGEPERPHGKDIAAYALERGIPPVLVTGTFHNQEGTAPIDNYAREKGIPLFDSGDAGAGEYVVEAQLRGDLKNYDTKAWDKGFLGLVYLIQAKETGKINITGVGITKVGEPTHEKGEGEEEREINGPFFEAAQSIRVFYQSQSLEEGIAELERAKELDELGIVEATKERFCKGMYTRFEHLN